MLQEILTGIAVLAGLAALIASVAWFIWRNHRMQSVTGLLKRHFRPTTLDRIAVTERQFPVHIRADLQRAIDEYVADVELAAFTGLQAEVEGMGGVDITSLLDDNLFDISRSTRCVPPQYEQIDIGEDEPLPTLKNGLWLLQREATRFAVLYAPILDYGACGIARRIRIQVAAPNDEAGAAASQSFFQHVESQVLTARCYRGKVLSLEGGESYFGQSSGVQVHRLGQVERDEVILPPETIDLLDRNVIRFVKSRAELDKYQMAVKKGLLFYGPPGTGKTHTVRYLAGSLPEHTTLLISAEQVGLLGEYMTLARLLQPSIVVIEDVDLIARDRASMNDPGAELLLNKLLNEMDGLREDSAILFILTTNRPEQLEAALASRPGRIDQAIEFPLPNADGRGKLVRLYSRGMTLSDEVAEHVVERTENVSASFIKELMRRSAQSHLERDGTSALSLGDVDSALEEMLFAGGSLNLKLLGAEQRIRENS